MLRTLIIALMFLLTTVGSATAAMRIDLLPSGDSSVTILGSGMEGVAVLDLELSYDPDRMLSPLGVRGPLVPSDAIFNFNPATPGRIRLFIRMGGRAVNGSGQIASITFTRVGDAAVEIRSISANLVTVKGTSAAVATRILSRPTPETAEASSTGVPPTVPAADPAPDTSRSPVPVRVAVADLPPRAPVSIGTGMTAGSVTSTAPLGEKGADRADKPEGEKIGEERVEAVPVPAPRAATPQDSAASPSAAESAGSYRTIEYPGVLARFKGYEGAKTLSAFVSLFNPPADQLVVQEPLAVVTDGGHSLTVRVTLPTGARETPVFSLKGASVLAVEQGDDGSWNLGVMPERGVSEALLTVRYAAGRMTWPLTVVPPLDQAVLPLSGSSEADYAHAIGQRGKMGEPLVDVNRDGLYDYRDDYLLSGHFLALRATAAAPSPAPPARPGGRP